MHVYIIIIIIVHDDPNKVQYYVRSQCVIICGRDGNGTNLYNIHHVTRTSIHVLTPIAIHTRARALGEKRGIEYKIAYIIRTYYYNIDKHKNKSKVEGVSFWTVSFIRFPCRQQ